MDHVGFSLVHHFPFAAGVLDGLFLAKHLLELLASLRLGRVSLGWSGWLALDLLSILLFDLLGGLLLDGLLGDLGLVLHLTILDLSFDEVFFAEVAFVVVARTLGRLLFFAFLLFIVVLLRFLGLWRWGYLDFLLWSWRCLLGLWLLLLLLCLHQSWFGLSSWGGLLWGLFLGRGSLLSSWLWGHLLDWLLLNCNDWSFLFILHFLFFFLLYLGFQFGDFSIDFSLSFFFGLDLGLSWLVGVLL